MVAAAGMAVAMTAVGLDRPVIGLIATGAVAYLVVLIALQSFFRRTAPSIFTEARA